MTDKILRRNKKVDEKMRDIAKGAWARMANGIPNYIFSNTGEALPSHLKSL